MTTIRVELHCHTYFSKDSLIDPEALLVLCRTRGIDRIAITDHNAIDGALLAAEIDPRRVIISEEIMTTQGELLAYYVKQHVPPGLPPMEAIAQLREQGAVISIAHPFDVRRSGAWKINHLAAILGHVDAIEVFNGRSWSQSANRSAASLAEEHQLLQTAGSDAHGYMEVGRTYLELAPFNGPDEFRISLRQSKIRRHRSSALVHIISGYATLRKKLGWKPPL
ncbi:MAG: PHP domain-containing protein [Chloroflexi bacterium]|nr:PHP domain-containing protein [Chloroflexota bacterium]